MRAAIYARKSTEQEGVSDELKSVARQVENAKAYAAKHGWHVNPAHVFMDDAISGAEFKNRPGLNKLRATLARPPFQLLIVADESRLGREMRETFNLVCDIVEAGVRIHCYATGKELAVDSAMAKLTLLLTHFKDETVVEDAGRRTLEGEVKRLLDGHATGGRLYGYRTQPHYNARGEVTHATIHVDPEQAPHVVRLFEGYASGLGFRRLAFAMNAEHIPGPRGGAWASTGVREMLRNARYTGVRYYKKTRRVVRRGETGKKQKRPKEDWLKVEQPELRIISDALWERVQTRLHRLGAAYRRGAEGKLVGRRPREGGTSYSAHLLTGFLACAECGGSIVADGRYGGSGIRRAYYACQTARRRGPQACTNRGSLPGDLLEETVIEVLAERLNPRAMLETVEAVRAEAKRTIASETMASRRDAIEREFKQLEGVKGRLVEAIAMGIGTETPAALVAKLQETEARERTLREEIDAMREAELPAGRWRVLWPVEGNVADLQREEPQRARQVLERLAFRLLIGAPVIRPDGTREWPMTLTGDYEAAPDPEPSDDPEDRKQFTVRIRESGQPIAGGSDRVDRERAGPPAP